MINLRKWMLVGLISVPGMALQAQEMVREKQVPQEIRDDFGLRFSEAESISWLKEGDDFFGARFKVKGKDVQAVYGADGQWVQTAEQIPYLAMPDPARDYCRGNYPDYSANDVKKVSTRRYGILYEIRISGERKQIGMTFDMHGKLLEEKEAALEGENAGGEQHGVKGKLQGLLKKD